jgi:hypothetical protein
LAATLKANPGWYSVTTKILSADQPSATRLYVVDDYTDGYGIPDETVAESFLPKAVTEVVDRLIPVCSDDEGFIDKVTLSAADRDGTGATVTWPTVNGAKVPAVGTVTVYRLDHPQAATATLPSGATLVGSFDYTFTSGPGTYTLDDSVWPQAVKDAVYGVPGAYSVKIDFLVAKQGVYGELFAADVVGDYTIPAETVSAQYCATVESEAQSDSVVLGGSLADTGQWSGIPATHGDYQGTAPLFDADVTVWTMRLYSIPRADYDVAGVDVPAAATLLKTYSDRSFDNVRWRVGQDVHATSANTCYVWVADFPGDTTVAPYRSAFNDPWEKQCTAKPDATLRTQPTYQIVAPGAQVQDQVWYDKAPDGAQVEVWWATSPVVDASKPVDEWVCDVNQRTGGQLTGPATALSTTSGTFKSAKVTAPAGVGQCVLFKAVLKDRDGNTLVEGTWGDTTEIAFVSTPPEVQVRTMVVDKYVTPGSQAQDEGFWTGATVGDTVTFEYVTVPVKDTSVPVDQWVCDLTKLDTSKVETAGSSLVQVADGSVKSQVVDAPAVGECVIFHEVITGFDGEVKAEGRWDDLSEQVFVAEPTVHTLVVNPVIDATGTAQDHGWWEDAPAGSTVEFWYREAPVKDTSKPVNEWECDLTKMTDPAPAGGPWTIETAGDGDRLSDTVRPSKAGVCILFLERVTYIPGGGNVEDEDDDTNKKTVEGEWGDLTEIVFVKTPETTTPFGASQTPYVATRTPFLAVTGPGASPVGGLSFSGAFLMLGVWGLLRRRDRLAQQAAVHRAA